MREPGCHSDPLCCGIFSSVQLQHHFLPRQNSNGQSKLITSSIHQCYKDCIRERLHSRARAPVLKMDPVNIIHIKVSFNHQQTFNTGIMEYVLSRLSYINQALGFSCLFINCVCVLRNSSSSLTALFSLLY